MTRTPLQVRLVAQHQEWALGGQLCTVPAGQIVIAVSGQRSSSLLLDGRPIYLPKTREALISIDLTRSTGYHRIDLDGQAYWFGTEDAKLGLQGIEEMLGHLRTVGTGWTGQALFSDGSGIRDAHVLYAWLDAWADQALATVDSILTSPRPRTQSGRALSRRGGRAVLLSPTLRLLRSAPRQYLTENSNGLLKIANRRYDPLRVVVRKRATSLDTIANQRAVAILPWLVSACREVLESDPDSQTSVRCRKWANRAQTLLRRPLAQSLQPSAALSAAPRQAEEAGEARYRSSYEIARDLKGQFGWSASLTPLQRYSYVDYSDSIYQAYSASCLAQALDLKQTDPVLGRRPLAFTGPDFDLYYDTACPPEVLRSWRAASQNPDTSRPDLILYERSSGRVAVLDAKYRTTRGAASEDSRKEVTAYLGLYGIRGITIIYPGSGAKPNVISGHGRSIVEVPLVPPGDGFSDSVPAILATLEKPPY